MCPPTSRPSADRLRLLAEQAALEITAEGVALLDGEGCFVFVNRYLARVLGVEAPSLVGRQATGVLAPGAAVMEQSVLWRQQGAVERLDLPLLRADGQVVWVLLAASPIRDEQGDYVGALWMMTDITERRRSETALRVIADTSRALAAELDFDGVARAVSDALDCGVIVALTGRDETAVAMRACAATDPDLERRLRSLVGRVLSLAPGTVGEEVLRLREPVVLGPGGAHRLQPPFVRIAEDMGLGSVIVAPLLVHGLAIGILSFFRSAGTVALGDGDVGLVREIADRAALGLERARLFEEQRRSTDRLRLLADAGTLLSQSLNLEPTISSFARLAVQWFADACTVELFEGRKVTSHAVAACEPGLEEATVQAMAPYVQATDPPEGLRHVFDLGKAELVRDVDESVLRGLASDEEHVTLLRRLGLRSMILVPLVARGRAIGVVSLARTRDTPYDEDDLAVAAELGRRAALALDNARLFKQATDAIAVRDEFLSIASHELNTPLTPLKMQLDSLRRGKFPPERTAEKLDAASRQVTRLAKLVSELLDVSRISGGRLHLEPESVDLAYVVEEVVARMADEAERSGSVISVHAERPCTGRWDRMRIDQVVTNLLTNAIKYGAGKPIEVSLTCDEGGGRLVVRDHGIGIDPEHQRRIFERFERAASVRHYGGFGLGLWIVRQIVEASGGTISVESAPREGSTFVVALPVTSTR